MIVIPDIHGRTFWKEAVKNRQGNELIIFLGDYIDHYEGEIDAYTDTEITQEKSLDNFKEIVSFATNNKNVVLLLGNHDVEYFLDGCYPCRCYTNIKDEVKDIFLQNKNLFTVSHKYTYNGKTFLFSHAGITPKFIIQQYIEDTNLSGKDARDAYENMMLTQDDILSFAEKMNTLWKTGDYNSLDRILCHIGSARGGQGYGSPVWNDWGDMIYINLEEYGITEPVYQVVGHTQYNALFPWNDYPIFRIEETCVCLDCRTAFRLYYNEGEAVDFLPITTYSNAKYNY